MDIHVTEHSDRTERVSAEDDPPGGCSSSSTCYGQSPGLPIA